MRVGHCLVLNRDSGNNDVDNNAETCESLKNEESYSSVKVSIGNPPQTFQLVADTGSDNCIVKDCKCKQCLPQWGKTCFVEPKNSKSFKVPLFEKDASPANMMSFGSGDIRATIASDSVSVGSVQAYMENGVLLMMDHGLEIHSHFEGILGLGRPKSYYTARPGQPKDLRVPGFLDSASISRFSLCFNHKADGVLGINTPSHQNRMTSVGKSHWGLEFSGISIGDQDLKVGGFCSPKNKKAEIETACSIIPDTGTTLVMGPEVQIASLYEELCMGWQRCQQTHLQMQKEIKKLTKEGIKIDGPAAQTDLLQMDPNKFQAIVSRVIARSSEEMTLFDKNGDDVGQARIQSEMEKVMEKTSDMRDPADMPREGGGEFELPAALTLQLLMEHCSSWMGELDIDEEMPKLTFHVGDTRGNKDELIIKPSTYVFSRAVDVEIPSIRNVLGFPLKIRSTNHTKVCMMAFGAMDYSTELNGDVWIFGTPLFYDYTAHFDRGSGKPEDITMGFTPWAKGECGSCIGQKIQRGGSESLLDQNKSKVGLEALNYLSKDPIVRKLPAGMKYI